MQAIDTLTQEHEVIEKALTLLETVTRIAGRFRRAGWLCRVDDSIHWSLPMGATIRRRSLGYFR